MTLDELHVVEFAGSVAGAYASRLFVIGGARVTVVGRGALDEHQHAYLRQGTTAIDPGEPSAMAAIDWSAVDVVIESSADGPLDTATGPGVEADHVVRVAITPFGRSGPYASWSSSDLVDYAIGGHAVLYGHPDLEPLRGPPRQPAVAAGQYAFIGAMAALFGREATGHGQTVDVNHFQVMVALHQVTLLRWLLTGDVFTRMGNRYTGAGQPNGPYPCRDGVISIVGVSEAQVDALLAVTGLTHLMDEPGITSSLDFYNHPQMLDAPLRAWLAMQTLDEVVELFQALRIPACPLRTPLELLDDPQLVAREFFEPLGDASGSLVPGSPFTIQHRQPAAGTAWAPTAATGAPLAGLRVLDLARVWAGPLCARTLADLGAEVVWVEAPTARGPKQIPQSMLDATRYFPDDDPGERQWNRNGHFVKYALGKRSLAIDLQTPEGIAAFERVIPGFHVLLENFSPRVMPQFGLDEQRLHELHPDLIYLTMPGYGRSGPAQHWLAYGSSVDSHAGLSALTGYSHESPWKGGVAWPDPLAGLHACSAVLMQLWGSMRGAGGCTIEAAQFESTVAAIGDRVLAAQVEGPWTPTGNRSSDVAFEGVFRCRGDDAWIAVTAHDDDALLRLAEQLEVTTDEAALVAALETHAVRSDANEMAQRLQARGIAAGPAHHAPGIMADRHLAGLGAFVTVEQPDIGAFIAPTTPIHLSRTPARVQGPAPTLGQHNEQVLREAGLCAAEIEALQRRAVVATEPPR